MIRLSRHECNVLMHVLRDADSQDLMFTSEERGVYAELVGRIIDVGTGYDDGDTTTYRQAEPERDGYWECTRCEAHWTFTDGGPRDNNMRYCPECGRKITDVVPWDEREGRSLSPSERCWL